MSGALSGPVVCVSYLAAAALWSVPRFPEANQGAEILSVEKSIAADGPMAAAVLTALDVPAVLLSNRLGEDTQGSFVADWLRRCQVATRPDLVCPGAETPHIVIVADSENTRTWFVHLPGVPEGLNAVDLSAIASASLVYVDCYQLIEGSAIRAIVAARASGAPLLANLGGSPLSPSVAEALRGHPGLTLQTNVDDAAYRNAPAEAASLLRETGALRVIVTCGAYGAVALSRNELLRVPGFRATVRHTHCAGAAFSGGLLYGLREGWPLIDSLTLACASGTLRCERPHDRPMPTLAELREVIASRCRIRSGVTR